MSRFLFIISISFLIACKGGGGSGDAFEENSPMPGFDVEGSDPIAIMIADKVMNAMGGRKAWDNTRVICWTFFGKRKLVWDKHTGDVRIDYVDSDEKIIVNIHSMEGKVYKNGRELTDADSLARYLKKGKSIWINDSYWLVMPFKMKDSGVTLHYIGEDTLTGGGDAQFLHMTFKEVGDTPDNMYGVWVDFETNLVSQWAFFKSYEDADPTFVNPWLDYQSYGEILLSGDRGSKKITDIRVLEEVPTGTFNSFEEINI